MTKKKSILFIVKNKNEASSRFRVFAYLNLLKNDFDYSIFYAEYKNTKIPKIFRSLYKRLRFVYLLFLARKHDIIFMQRPMSSDKSNSVFFEWLLSKANPNIIFDFDDALFIQNEKKIRALISLSKTCICGNQYLADYAKSINENTFIIPTSIDTNKFSLQKKQANKNVLTIGWTGTSGNYDFFTKELIQDLTQVLHENTNLRFLFICDKKPDSRFNFDYDFIYWNASTEVQDLKQIDIGLMPLIDTQWTKGKCGFKLIQYGTISIPSIASDVGVNKEVLANGKSGLIINKKQNSWKKALESLILSPTLRIDMGIQAREHIQKKYSIEQNYPKIKHVLNHTIKQI